MVRLKEAVIIWLLAWQILKKRILKRQESGAYFFGILRSLKRKAKGGINSDTNNTACGAFRRIKNIHLFLLSFLSPGQRARWTALSPQLDSIKTSILRPNNLILHAELLPDRRGECLHLALLIHRRLICKRQQAPTSDISFSASSFSYL